MKHLAITSAVIAAAATQAHANVPIHLKSDMASQSAKDYAKAVLDRHEAASAIDQHIVALGDVMNLDGQTLRLDPRRLLAVIEGGDSTIQNIFDPNLNSGCYSNCYSNCHGSRSWR